jgi:homoserine O-acetyltransferase
MPVVPAVKRSWQHLVPPSERQPIVVLGGISATADARSWWPAIVGNGCCIDTGEFRVIGIDWLDGGQRADGRPERIVTTHDQADALAAKLDALGVSSVQAIVGASYGGMVALAFAERYPTRVDSLVVISAPARAHPMSTALRSLQRRIVELGLDAGRAHDALSIARGLATTTYRSAAEFAERFAVEAESVLASSATFPVESYLRHQGEKFAKAFTPSRFLALSLSADLHRVDPSRISVPATFVAARGDSIVPVSQMDELASRWAGPNRLIETATTTGHDAFLAEPQAIGPIIKNAVHSPSLT